MPLFAALTKAVQRFQGRLQGQGLANTAWAFAMAFGTALLSPVTVLDAIEARSAETQLMYQKMSMQGLVTTGDIEAAFALIARCEAAGMRPNSNCYQMFHVLLEACNAGGDSDGALRVQAMVARLGLRP